MLSLMAAALLFEQRQNVSEPDTPTHHHRLNLTSWLHLSLKTQVRKNGAANNKCVVPGS